MQFIADLHIHSKYSRATSKKLDPEHLSLWALKKGIKVVGSGDFTHPGWIKELEEKLVPAEQGLFRLKKQYMLPEEKKYRAAGSTRFMLTAEISNIYKKLDKVRKVHNLILAPDFKTVKRIQQQIKNLNGNIESDGRPILGLDSRDLLELALSASDNIFFIPAHIWTPWFSMLGSKSGFNNVKECYADLTDHIYAMETGLSSDPPMNWMIKFLDQYTLVSNSDAHSPEKLGREANLFDTGLSYNEIIAAVKKGRAPEFGGTIEFYAEEGKYHFDGHRKCGIVWDPATTRAFNNICPVCGRKVTIGVMNRVAQLSERSQLPSPAERAPFFSVIPLKEILAEITLTAPKARKVEHWYDKILSKGVSEFDLLYNLPLSDLKEFCGELLLEGISRMRANKVYIKAGYDGEFGRVKVFQTGETASFALSDSLFSGMVKDFPGPPSRPLLGMDFTEYRNVKKDHQSQKRAAPAALSLNEQQQQAYTHLYGPAVVTAGPGTGKTRVLTERINYLLTGKQVAPQDIAAITFTNKAAGEMRDRLQKRIGSKHCAALHISTFHALGLKLLKDYYKNFKKQQLPLLLNEKEKQMILKGAGCSASELHKLITALSITKQKLKTAAAVKNKKLARYFILYQNILEENSLMDLDDLLYQTVKAFICTPAFLQKWRRNFKWILVDEYQDINFAQYQLIRLLMPYADSNLFVIGDPDQAIYAFRGADRRYFTRFTSDYPAAATYRLFYSYRSTNNILRASKEMLSAISGKKEALRAAEKGVKIAITKQPTAQSEAEWIARTVEKSIGGVGFFSFDSQVTNGDFDKKVDSLSDIAVLARTHQQLNIIKKAFLDHNIPFQMAAPSAFTASAAWENVLLVFKALTASEHNFFEKLVLQSKILNESQYKKLQQQLSHNTAAAVVQTVINFLQPDKKEKKDTAAELVNIAGRYGNNYRKFFEDILLREETDPLSSHTEAVSLLTLHAAKGLEFKAVFISGCEQGMIPYTFFRKKSDIDEERRLFYVGMTRAKRFLYLSYACKRLIRGKNRPMVKSSFLQSIEDDLLDEHKVKAGGKNRRKAQQLQLF
ncbi:MAG TPA: UvrD-helicase domain-containing protein [Spirochaetota bacterium]|nr:UvrD-helicase domain-containing protein [Spirochaetota bacterium]